MITMMTKSTAATSNSAVKRLPATMHTGRQHQSVIRDAGISAAPRSHRLRRTRVEPVALLIRHLGIHVGRHDPVVVVMVEVGALPRRHLDFLHNAQGFHCSVTLRQLLHGIRSRSGSDRVREPPVELMSVTPRCLSTSARSSQVLVSPAGEGRFEGGKPTHLEPLHHAAADVPGDDHADGEAVVRLQPPAVLLVRNLQRRHPQDQTLLDQLPAQP